MVEKDYLTGKVDNLPGYMVAALKHDYRPKAAPLEQAQHLCKQRAKVQPPPRKQAQAQREHLEREYRHRRLERALAALTVGEREQLERRFRETYAGNPIYQKWGKDGLTHPVMQRLFRAFASKVLLTEALEEDLAALAAGAGYDLQALRAAAAG